MTFASLRRVAVLAAVWSWPVLSQTQPDAGRILQETRPPLDRAPAKAIPPIEAPAQPQAAPTAPGRDVQVRVDKFSFTGNRALSGDDLAQVASKWSGRSLNFGELIEVVEAIEARYREAGYFLAQAYLPPQKIRDGAIEIVVSEGRLGDTRIEGDSLIASEVLYAYLDRLPKGEALKLPPLERQILLVNEMAGSRATLDLQAGEQPGTTDVVLALKPDERLVGRVELNNHGLPSTGEKRLGLTLDANSPFGFGERIGFNALTSENRNLASYNLRVDLPVGADGWHVLAGASRAEYTLGGSFASMDASGTADSQRIGVSYPILRSRNANVRLQVEADHSQLVDRIRSFSYETHKTSRGLTATLSGDWTDDFFGGGATRAEVALRGGELIYGANSSSTSNAGHFDKQSFVVQRQQMLARNWNLQVQWQQQYAGRNLDSSEKLMLGGPATLPGYANGEASGDEGRLVKLAVRWLAMPDLVLGAFADYGVLRLERNPAPGANNRKRLTDAGIVADWALGKGFAANAILAWAGKEAPNAADNDKPRFWFSLAYAW